jgi:orotidine-5'-phosphate decarboxylase
MSLTEADPQHFGSRLTAAVRRVGVPLAMGIDPHLDRLPEIYRSRYADRTTGWRARAAEAITAFAEVALDAAQGRVAAVKPQFAFFEQLGSPGWAALEAVCQMARQRDLLVIGDAKRGDISSTAAAYARAILDPEGPLGCDSLTVNPWMGSDTITPYLDLCREHGRGLFVLVRTTNPGSAELQSHGQPPGSLKVADSIQRLGQDTVGPCGTSSIGAVVGATVAEDAQALRARMPEAWFLVPGVGAQGGSAAQALAGAREDGLGALPVASRSLLFPGGEGFDEDPGPCIESAIEALSRSLRMVWSG